MDLVRFLDTLDQAECQLFRAFGADVVAAYKLASVMLKDHDWAVNRRP